MPRAGCREKYRPADQAGAIAARREELRSFVLESIAEERTDYSSPCWAWQRFVRKDGYSEADLGNGVGRIKVHRLSYTVLVGKIPDGLTIDHLCRNRRCVNPAHLEPVTLEENNRRANPYRSNKSRATTTHCTNGHERAVVGSYPRGGCKACQRAYQLKWDAANPDKIAAKRRRANEKKRLRRKIAA